MHNIIHNGDCLTWLKTLPNNSVNMCVTSPPYYGLRDYGNNGQIGLEETPEAYVQKLVDVFREIKRVLKDNGTLWLNIGDSYYNKSQAGGGDPTIGIRNIGGGKQPKPKIIEGLKPKDLIGIPWMVAFALRADGWYLRQDIIWSKPNPMPESVTDRCTKAHEYIFLMSKNRKYYYDADAIATEINPATMKRAEGSWDEQSESKSDQYVKTGAYSRSAKALNAEMAKKILAGEKLKINRRSVWTVGTKPFKEAHFATFPEGLIIDCIKAGCPTNGIVLDPFGGALTTAVVSAKLNRFYWIAELNNDYIQIGKRRLHNALGIFND